MKGKNTSINTIKIHLTNKIIMSLFLSRSITRMHVCASVGVMETERWPNRGYIMAADLLISHFALGLWHELKTFCIATCGKRTLGVLIRWRENLLEKYWILLENNYWISLNYWGQTKSWKMPPYCPLGRRGRAAAAAADGRPPWTLNDAGKTTFIFILMFLLMLCLIHWLVSWKSLKVLSV